MKSPLYEARPARMNEEHEFIPCAEDFPEKVGYTIVMIEEGTGTVKFSGYIYGSLEAAQERARNSGTVVIHEHMERMITSRTTHFATPESIMEELEQIATEDGFGSVHAFELFWGVGGQEMHRQWRLDID
jgi:hypothetical protein